jgi:hypothetical protein
MRSFIIVLTLLLSSTALAQPTERHCEEQCLTLDENLTWTPAEDGDVIQLRLSLDRLRLTSESTRLRLTEERNRLREQRTVAWVFAGAGIVVASILAMVLAGMAM